MSPVRSARSRRLLLASRHIRTATPFSLTSIRIRTPTTSTAAPPAMTSASPDAGALASPLHDDHERRDDHGDGGDDGGRARAGDGRPAHAEQAGQAAVGVRGAAPEMRAGSRSNRAAMVSTQGARPNRHAATIMASCSRIP